jgi:hypothetical protein
MSPMPSAPLAVRRGVRGKEEGALFLGPWLRYTLPRKGKKDRVLGATYTVHSRKTIPLKITTVEWESENAGPGF